MTSLPHEVPRFRDNTYVIAYSMCLRLEKSLQEAANDGQDVEKELIYIRILGFLLHHVPTDFGLKTIVYEISSTAGDSILLLQVGKVYFDHYIKAFKADKGRTPLPSSPSSRTSFDSDATDMNNDVSDELSQSHSTAKKNALIRDGYRCIVSNYYDFASVSESQELTDMIVANNLYTITTFCAHIFPEYTDLSIEPCSAKYASSLWGVMERFGQKNLPEELNGPKIHRLENVMTVACDFQIQFDNLRVWFVPTEDENKYKLVSPFRSILLNYQEYITFTTPDPVEYPVPSRTYLDIHAACAKVAHLSGAREYIEKLYEEMENRETLDPDGGSGDVLEHAFSGLEVADHHA